MGNLKLKTTERKWLQENITFMPPTFFEYLANYKFNPDEVTCYLDEDDLVIRIKGKWRDTILWEVPLMAIISEVYFHIVDKDWSDEYQLEKAMAKVTRLTLNDVHFSDFGTRRRRSHKIQETVLDGFTKLPKSTFIGTSNPYFAMKFNTKCMGTCAHEAIGAVAALDSLNHPNKIFMDKWTQTYKGRLGIMLPDTFGINSFFKDFDIQKAKLWDGLRHDSGDPVEFVDKVRDHYMTMGIDPKTKTIVFSDSLNVEKAIELNEYCKNKINCSFGIGTHFTNDFKDSPALNMVIKLIEADGVPVVKLGEGDGKGNGDQHMIEVMKYIHKKDNWYAGSIN